MKRQTVVIAAMLFIAIGTSTPISAFDPEEEGQIPSCGSYGKATDMQQATDGRGHWAKGLESYFETTRDQNGCGYQVRVEGKIEGLTDWSASTSFGIVAWKTVYKSTDNFGVYTAKGKHFAVWLGIGSLDLGLTSDQVTMAQSEEHPEENEEEPEVIPEIWNDPNGSPIVFDMNHDGFKLTSMHGGVDFDLDADGVPDRVAWTEVGSDDAWLALDRNGNGKIDNGGELFGNFTQARSAGTRSANGFEALRFLEADDVSPGSGDQVIDSADAVFARLLLWCDKNHNGVSEKEELTPLSQSAIARIGTNYKRSDRRDEYGNAFKLLGGAEWKMGPTHAIYDVYLVSSLDPFTRQ